MLVCGVGIGHNYRQAKVILKASGDDAHFMYGNVMFEAGTDESAVPYADGDYDYVLLDLGQADYVGDNILERCDELFLVGDLSVWSCADSAASMLRMRRRYDKRLRFLSAFCSRAGIKEFERLTGERACVIPIDAEPFAISRDTLIFMERLFGGEYLKIKGCKIRK